MPHPMAKAPVRKSKFTRAKAEELFGALAADRPDPGTELDFVNPFTLVVPVALSAQATDVSVNKATRGLFAMADTPQAMLDLGEERVREAIRTIGLYRNKARNVILLSEQLITGHGGEVPEDRDALDWFVEAVHAEQPAAVLCTGDLTMRGTGKPRITIGNTNRSLSSAP